MHQALDFLGAHPRCIISEYTRRVDFYINLDGVAPQNLSERMGWQNCASVIDPLDPQKDAPDGRINDVGWRLSDRPGITVAERCRAVLPVDAELESHSGMSVRDEDGIARLVLGITEFDDCDAWADWVVRLRDDKYTPTCERSGRLTEEWMEHYRGMPENVFTLSC